MSNLSNWLKAILWILAITLYFNLGYGLADFHHNTAAKVRQLELEDKFDQQELTVAEKIIMGPLGGRDKNCKGWGHYLIYSIFIPFIILVYIVAWMGWCLYWALCFILFGGLYKLLFTSVVFLL